VTCIRSRCRHGSCCRRVDIAGGGEHTAEVIVGGDRLHEIDQRIVLAAERDRTISITGQADIGLTTEYAATLTEAARARIEAIFQLEDRRQAATENFRALEPPATARQIAGAAVAERLKVLAPIGVIHVRERRIDRAVQRHTRLCVG